ncbi:MAG: aminopeptidase P family N-terminal domain-containing protein, partial [Bacteroidaceae bacterium]|nr:aminopeptidase P family N-terminal domain-containing protein [Bacteroidaceae bacterium]
MDKHGLDAFVFPSSDPHNGEYVPSHWKTREWISGFNGSAGTAVVTRGRAALWTDSRYFLAAEEQLQETPFALMRERISGTPSVAEWLSEEIGTGGRVGVDGWVFSIAEEHVLREELAFHGLDLVLADDPAETLWAERPPIPQAPVCLHPIAYAGKSAADKIKNLRERLLARHVEATLVCKLDEVAWLANIRGTDVHCCPLVV